MTNPPEVPPSEDDVRFYSTPEMTVEWRASRCQHSGRCVRYGDDIARNRTDGEP